MFTLGAGGISRIESVHSRAPPPLPSSSLSATLATLLLVPPSPSPPHTQWATRSASSPSTTTKTTTTSKSAPGQRSRYGARRLAHPVRSLIHSSFLPQQLKLATAHLSATSSDTDMAMTDASYIPFPSLTQRSPSSSSLNTSSTFPSPHYTLSSLQDPATPASCEYCVVFYRARHVLPGV